MCALTTVGVNDDFAAGQSGVTVGTADNKLARWVDVIFDVALGKEGFHFGCVDAFFNDARNEDADDVFADFVHHHLVGLLLATCFLGGDKLIMLR